MSKEKCDTQDDCIAADREAFKEELKTLTKAERMLIIDEYKNLAHQFGVGMKEFSVFMNLFDELEV